MPTTTSITPSSAKLDTFVWEGTNKRGEHLKGEQNASNPTFVKAELRRQGILPTRIRKKRKPLFSPKKIEGKDITTFTRQMSTMITAGIPLIQALDLVARGHDKPAMQAVINNLKTTIEGGNSVNDALKLHPNHFNELYCNLIGAGERSGSLDLMFDRLSTYREKTESIRAKVKKALFYPIAVLVVALLVSVGMLVFVVPQFESLFSGFGAQLPAPTRVVMNMSKFLTNYWYVFVFGIVGGAYVFKMLWKKSPPFVNLMDRVMLKIPVVGDILVKATISRFSRTLATTFTAGLPLVEALDAVAGACGNRIYANATLKIKEKVSSGQTLQQAMQQANLFPNMAVQMIAIGEESGSLESMLNKVASIYEEQVDNLVDSLSSLIEPVIMAVLGVVIGGLVVAMYLPIFKLGSVIK